MTLDDTDAERVLADLATLGPAFVVATGAAPEGPAGWRPLVELATDPEELASRVAGTRERLGVTEDRVAASVVFQGLAARVVAPLLGAAVLHDRLLHLTAETLHWRPWGGGVVPLWVPPWVGAPSSVAVAPHRLADAIATPLALLAAAVRQRARVSERLLWGDVTAAVGGVLRVVSRERPAALGRAGALAGDLLSRRPLAGTGSVVPTPGGLSVARRTCCLVYRAPGAVTCSDCVFGAGREGPAPVRRPGRPGGGSSR